MRKRFSEVLVCWFLGFDNFRVGFAAGEAAFFGGEFEGFFAVEFGLADEFVDAISEGLRSVTCNGLAGERSTDKEGDFATDGFFFEGGGEFGERGAAELFMELGDFAGEAGGTFAEDFKGVGDGFGDAMGSFVKDESAIFKAEAFEGAAAFASACGEKADEEELFVGQAGSGESREKRGWSGDGDDGDLVAIAESDESIAGIADERRAGVTDEGDFGALLHGDDEFGGASEFVVLVVGDEGLADFVVGEEFLGVAGVFAGDFVGLFEDAEGAEGDVLEVADRGADEVEAAAGIGGRGEHGGSVAWGGASETRLNGMENPHSRPGTARHPRSCRVDRGQHVFAAAYRRGHDIWCPYMVHGYAESSRREERGKRAWYTAGFRILLEERAVPLYEYECVKCGTKTEKIENVSGPHLKKCPKCGGKVERLLTAPAIQFKGSGWYVTDYAGKSPAKDGGASEKSDGEKSEKKDKDGAGKESTAKETKETKETKDSSEKKSSKKK